MGQQEARLLQPLQQHVGYSLHQLIAEVMIKF
jgi:hypothetical protein